MNQILLLLIGGYFIYKMEATFGSSKLILIGCTGKRHKS